MNNNDTPVTAPIVTYSNIPLDDSTTPVGYDTIPGALLEVPVVDVQFKKGGKLYYFDPGSLTVPDGADVIIETARGAEFGFCVRGNHIVPGDQVIQPLRPVVRLATEQDRRMRADYKAKEPYAFETCQSRIAAHNLDMKLVSADYSFDGSKILFYFTADGRVDFRDLVKDLASVFRTRIELRQIGVRDEAKMLGGLGICGRPFCCKQFLDDFQPVSIKMAKTQSLSLNPTKISGTCGRLMCCLNYEQHAYESLLKTTPKQDSLVNTCDGVGAVTEVNILKQTVKVRMTADPSTIKCFQNCDVCVLRSGKGKKTDPPIDTNIPPLPKPKEPAVPLFDESAIAPAAPATGHTPRTYGSDRSERTDRSDRTDRGDRSDRKRPARSDNRPRKTDTSRKTSAPRPKQKDGKKPASPDASFVKIPQKDVKNNYRRKNNNYRGQKKQTGEKSGE